MTLLSRLVTEPQHWADRLRPASFRGVPFSVPEHSADDGRRLARHEFPGRERPVVDDLGRATREWTVEAFVVGDDYMERRDQLVAACAEAPGPGELVHPHLGTLRVHCESVQYRESNDEHRVARFTITFVDAGDEAWPQLSEDLQKAARDAAEKTIAESMEAFTQEFLVDGLPGQLVSAIGDTAQTALESVRALTDALMLPAQEVASLRDDILRAQDNIEDLMREPDRFADEMRLLKKKPVLGAPSARDGVRAARRMSDFDPETSTPQTPRAEHREQTRRSQRAIVRQEREVAACLAAEAAVDVEPDSYDDAVQLRKSVTDRLQAAMQDPSSDEVYAGLRELQVAIMRAIPDEAEELPALDRVEVDGTVDALTLGWRWKRDPSAGIEIAARNQVLNPCFLSGEIEVLR